MMDEGFKKLTLCADDYGFNASVSEGILDCIKLNRLSAVSCMANMPDFNSYASQLTPFKNKIQIGLHLNLTEGFFLSMPDRPCFSLKELLIKSHLHLLDVELIKKELHAQLDHYMQLMGDLPEFIDGHQHIHHFPQIGSIVLDIYEQKLRAKKTWVRSTYPYKAFFPYAFKAQILSFTGARALKKQLVSLKIPHNSSFSGIYDFTNKDYRALFQHWLQIIPSGTLMMCHPGKGGEDGIATARKAELDYLLSNSFLQDCLQFKVRLSSL